MDEGLSRKRLSPVIVPGARFIQLNKALLALLQSLEPREWELPTVCDGWVVKDIAAHILDGILRRLAIHRDAYQSPRAKDCLGTAPNFTAFITRLNQSWTTAADRWSPRLLIDLLDWAEPQCAAFFDTLPPDSPAFFEVSWAGSDASHCWMDVARDFTERWNHHRQIAEAVGRGAETLERIEFLGPVMNAYARSLAPALEAIDRPDGTAVRVVVDEASELKWDIVRIEGVWILCEAMEKAAAVVTIPPHAAWFVFTKRRTSESLRALYPAIHTSGDPELCTAVLQAVAMVA